MKLQQHEISQILLLVLALHIQTLSLMLANSTLTL
jgi:hypothetical protein